MTTNAAERDPLEVVTGKFDQLLDDGDFEVMDGREYEQLLSMFIEGYEFGIDRGIELAFAANEGQEILDLGKEVAAMWWGEDDEC